MLCIVGLDNKLYKIHGTYIKIKKLCLMDVTPLCFNIQVYGFTFITHKNY